MVFGSDGGGALYAMSVTTAVVYRLQQANEDAGCYSSDSSTITVAGAHLQEFLGRVLQARPGFRRRRQRHQPVTRPGARQPSTASASPERAPAGTATHGVVGV